jgi:hypothetical protein
VSAGAKLRRLGLKVCSLVVHARGQFNLVDTYAVRVILGGCDFFAGTRHSILWSRTKRERYPATAWGRKFFSVLPLERRGRSFASLRMTWFSKQPGARNRY